MSGKSIRGKVACLTKIGALKQTWEEKTQRRETTKLLKEREKQMKQEKQVELEKIREKRLENQKRREANSLRSEQYQLVRN